MKLQLGAFLTLWILCLVHEAKAGYRCPYGKRNVTENTHTRVKRVIGGHEARSNSWPWIVSFVDDKNRQQCAGTIIDHEWILTAAHCFLSTANPGPPFNNFTYRVADHIYNKTDDLEFQVEVLDVFFHPKYVMGGLVSPGDYDIALMKLSKPLNFTQHVQPVCLAEKEDIFDAKDTCFLIGWGNTKNTASYHRSPYLKQLKIDLVTLEECNSNSSYKGYVSERFLCAGRKQGGIDGCYGDSGGPLQCEMNGTWVQIGIMIWGIGCAEPNHYGVYSDVRVLQPFIKDIKAGPNSNLTAYLMKTLGDVGGRSSDNLYKLLTNESEFSDVDLVRNFKLLPYQIKLLNKTTLMDLQFVSLVPNLTMNTSTLANISDVLVGQVERLYVYYKSREIIKEFNVTFEEIYKSINLTKDGFLNSEFSVLEKIMKQMYIKRYVNNVQMYRDILTTYQHGLNVRFNTSQIEKDLDKSVNYLKKLEKKALKQILVQHNEELFTKMLSVRNISSFFEISLEKLKNMTVGSVLTEYLNISLTTFASLHGLENRQIVTVKMKKISTVPKSEDQSIYSLVIMLEIETDRNSEKCGIRSGKSGSRRKRVIGGNEASENSWPWMVNFVDSNSSRQYCAGSIIDRNWILTAGHCFVLSEENILPLSKYTYHVGDHLLNLTDTHEYTIKTSKIFIHPYYIGGTDDNPGDYDISLIELEKPLRYNEYVRPVCLGEIGERFVNDSCYVSGWGNTKNLTGYHRSPVLKQAELDLVPLSECNSNTSYQEVVPDRFLCAGFKQGGTDSCSGDSGGPLQCDHNGSWTQIGIVSWGKGCAQPNYYGVYSKVESLLPFIKAVISGPNRNLTSYLNKTLEEVIPRMSERQSRNLHELLTNSQVFSAIDLVRNLQVFPYQMKLLNKTTLQYLIFVSDEENLSGNETTLKYIAQMFLHGAKRLRMYMRSKELEKELDISFDNVLQLSGLTKETFLDSNPEVLEKVKNKTLQINKLVEKLVLYQNILMTYKNNLNVSLNLTKVKQHFYVEMINAVTEKELKKILVRENKMAFTKIMSLRNISNFFNISRASLKNQTIPYLLINVLEISIEDYASLHMFTVNEVKDIEKITIATIPLSDEKSIYEITNAILQSKALVPKCNERNCSINGECSENSCRCKKGYIGNGFKCDTGNTIFQSQLVLNQTFTQSLNNPDSYEYRNLAEKIQNGLTNVIKERNNFPGFLGCQVTGFQTGSVIANYVIIFDLRDGETVNASQLSQVVSRAVQSGSLEFPVLSSGPITTSDSCALNFHSCHVHATCRFRDGIVLCKCKDNYYGDGVQTCVDPCKGQQCPPHSYCLRELNGMPKCICDPGYFQEGEGCEKGNEDFKTALIIVSCVAGTLLLLALIVCWCYYCKRNTSTSVEISPDNKGRANSAYDSMNMYNLE